jgi:hypothetical protein
VPKPNLVRVVPHARRAIFAAACPLLLGGCMGWAERPAPAPAASRIIHGPVRVTRTDGSSVVLADAIVRDDSIMGAPNHNPDTGVSLPLSNVRKVEVRHIDVASTTWAVLTGGAAAARVALYILFMGPGLRRADPPRSIDAATEG